MALNHQSFPPRWRAHYSIVLVWTSVLLLSGCGSESGPPSTAGKASAAAPPAPLSVKTLASGLYDPTEFELKSEITGTIALPKGASYQFASLDYRRVVYSTVERPLFKVHLASDDGKVISVDVPTKVHPQSSEARDYGVPSSLLSWTATKLTSFTPDGKTIAFVTYPVGDLNPVIVHGQKVSEPLGPHQNMLFLDQSPDGARLAYGAGRNHLDVRASSLTIDGKKIEFNGELATFEPLLRNATREADRKHDDRRGVFFSPDSRRYAAVVLGREKKDAHLLVDGALHGPYETAWQPIWSPDSKHFACVVVPKGKETRAVMVDGKIIKEYPYIVSESMKFHVDSVRLLFVAGETSMGPFFVVDGEKDGKRYPYIRHRLWPLPDGRTLYNAGFGKGDDEKEYAFTVDLNFNQQYPPSKRHVRFSRPGHVLDGQEHQHMIDDFAMNSKGELAIIESRGQNPNIHQFVVVHPAETGPEYRSVRYLSYSPSGAHFAYVSCGTTVSPSAGDAVLHVDGVSFPEVIEPLVESFGWSAHTTAVLAVRWESDTTIAAAFYRNDSRLPTEIRRVRFTIVPRVRKAR